MTYDVQCDIWYHDRSLVVAVNDIPQPPSTKYSVRKLENSVVRLGTDMLLCPLNLDVLIENG